MATQPTPEDLIRRMADPRTSERALRRYFRVNPEASGPFDPVLELNPATVALPADPEVARARSAAALNAANWWARMRRRTRFERRLAEGYAGPVIVSEGDSWFQYPILLDDVIDHLSRPFAIRSLDAAGDTLANMLAEGEYRTALAETRASILLFSAGGNDLLGGGNLAGHLRAFDPAEPNRAPADYLLPSYGTVLAEALSGYAQLLHDVEQNASGVTVICHGYDRPLPANQSWLGQPMASRGITDPSLQEAIAAVMIDGFNDRLIRLVQGYPRARCVDVRGVVGRRRWHDELHPTDGGFRDVAARFEAMILAAGGRSAPPRGARRRRAAAVVAAETTAPTAETVAARPRRGVSLHVGLNAVDPQHYAGWDGVLAACEFDAEDMERIARSAGFTTTRLLTAAATRAAVSDAISAAANDLRSGDIFLISYSGHGGQVPDFNGDEADAIDETWCLYDAQLIDDELYQLWGRFREGVRVLVVSDSCHSGTVIKAALTATMPEPVDDKGRTLRRRTMPTNVAARVFRQNRDFYTEVGRGLPWGDELLLAKELTHPVACTVRLLSGCQDNQYSYDGLANGQFTAALLNVWADGRFQGDYHRFHREILRQMPPHQTPNHWVVGQPDPVYDRQRPFEI